MDITETVNEQLRREFRITVGKNVGMAYVPRELATAGTQLFIDCRGKTVPAEVVSGPFYRRP